MIEFEKPNIHKIDENDNYGKFVVEPLERGYGTTLGIHFVGFFFLLYLALLLLVFKLMVFFMNFQRLRA